ncbi:MAG: hypothetical protein MJZ82_04495 [Paludibacteraceae bacterium]|nr:hypothetical protein [Paludibacteraceae bacterium]
MKVTDIPSGSIVTIQSVETTVEWSQSQQKNVLRELSTTHYMAVDAKGNIVTLSTPSVYALWEYKIVNGQVQLKNLGLQKYLYFVPGQYDGCTLTMSTSPQGINVLSFTNYSASSQNEYLKFVELQYNGKRSGGSDATYYLHWNKDNASFIYQNSHAANTDIYNISGNLRIQVWGEHKAESQVKGLAMSFELSAYSFGFQNDALNVSTPAQTVNCLLSYSTSSPSEYYYNKSNTTTRIYTSGSSSSDDDTETDAQVLYNQGIIPTFSWESNGLSTVSSDNGTAMMTMSTPQIAQVEGRNVWQFTLTPNGNSPLAERSVGGVSDYVDRIVATATVNSKPVTATCEAKRLAIVYEDVEGLDVQMSPSTFVFTAAGGTKTMNISMKLKDARLFYFATSGLKENFEINRLPSAEEIDLTDPNNNIQYTISPLDNDNGVQPTWLTVSPSGTGTNLSGNTLTLTTTVNGGNLSRSARLNSSFSYTVNGKTYSSGICQAWVTQTSPSGEYGQKFVPNIGKGDVSLDAQGRQKVHEYHKTVYYTPGEVLRLLVPGQTFPAYVRWYDYETNLNPEYNTDPAGFKWRDYGGLTDAHFGLYATHKGEVYPRSIDAWNDGQTHIIACDMSDCTDYTDNSTTVKEPTLQYRLVYHCIPASVIADSLTKCTGGRKTGNYYEEHNYVIPYGRDVYLETNFRYKNTYQDESEKCYYYWNQSHQLTKIDGNKVQWWRDDEQIGPSYIISDLLTIHRHQKGKSTYYLRYVDGSTEINLARFNVTVIDPAECGPSTDALVTAQDIERDYISMSYNDFNYGYKPTSYHRQFAPVHLAWEDASYGHYYDQHWVNGYPGRYQTGTSSDFPYYGQYVLVNAINEDFAKGESYGGKANDYSLYVDGMMEPGMVVSIDAKTKICSGQLMYCSAWINNVCPSNYSGADPIFRFNVQGRNADNEDWEDVGVFMVGKLAKASGWQQVRFPLESAKDYNQVRVSLYNFAESSQSNDFMVDEFRLYASRLALTSYQVSTSCKATDSIISVIRLDYMSLDEERWAGKSLYYDLYNATRATKLSPSGGYFYEPSTSDETLTYGKLNIPAKTYNPSVSNPEMVYESASEFISLLQTEYANGDYSRPLKGFVKETVGGQDHWILYLVHTLGGMSASNIYLIRMASEAKDLDHAECAMTTQLNVSKQTGIKFEGEALPDNENNQCANGVVGLSMDVSNLDIEGEVTKGTCSADWLIGIASDNVYLEGLTPAATDAQRSQADSEFEAYYHYSRTVVRSALTDLRRADSETDQTSKAHNPNREVSNANLLVREGFNNEDYYDVIMYLVNNNLLLLNASEQKFYMGAGQDLYTWVYPIPNTGISEDGDSLLVCDEPIFVAFHTPESQYILNLSTVPLESMTEEQRSQIPAVRASAYDANRMLKVPVSDIQNVVLGYDSTRLFATTDPVLKKKMEQGSTVSLRYYQDRIYQDASAAAYYQPGDSIVFRPVDAARVDANIQRHDEDNAAATDGHIVWTDGHPGWQVANTDTMRPGYEYTFKTNMMTTTFQAQLPDFCPIGEAYFTLVVVPDTMLWSPKGNEYNDWSDDDNWRCIVNGKTLDHGYVPMKHTVVIIPKLAEESLYPYISGNLLSIDAHFKPNVCKHIHFEGYAKMLRQENLSYQDASAVLAYPAADWIGVSTPFNSFYSGDMYQALDEDDDICKAAPLDYVRGTAAGNHFWASYYNRTVGQVGVDGNVSESLGRASQWTPTNSMVESIAPGKGFSVLSYGPNYSYGTAENRLQMNVRLPKTETAYTYSRYGDETDVVTETIDRTGSNRLALTFTGQDSTQTFHLTNATADQWFLFGNPTMAYIDMQQMLTDNGLSTTFYYAEESEWVGATPASADQPQTRYLAPMRSALIKATAADTELDVVLRKNHLVLKTDMNRPVVPLNPSQAPRRNNGVRTGYLHSDVMNIYMYNDNGGSSMRLCLNSLADDAYVDEEDAKFIYSPNVDISQMATPMNVYTLAGDVALIADVREWINHVPLLFMIDATYATPTIKVYFNLSKDWPEYVWLYDQQTDLYYPIYDGITYELDCPDNHELRYYIVGGSSDDPTVPTALDEVEDDEKALETYVTDWNLDVYNSHAGHATLFCDLSMTDIVAYDLAGRVIAHIAPNSTSATLALPQGVALFEVTTPAGKRVVRSIIK